MKRVSKDGVERKGQKLMTPPLMLTSPVAAPIAWCADTLLENDGLTVLDCACLEEIRATAALLSANPLPVTALSPDDFDMPHCQSMMAAIRGALNDGIGFAIVDRLPVDEFRNDISVAVYWILMSMLGRTVAQKWNGLMLYDVLDTGEKQAVGRGVRGSRTNEGQGYHTDNSYNLPPQFVSLLCLQTAMRGGVSGLVSFYSAHNELLARYPHLLPRLYEPFYFERYAEFAPGESAISEKPIFSYDGERLGVSLSTGRVRAGYEAAGVQMDDRTRDALAALDEVLELPHLSKRFDFERGQIQVVNNRKLGHRRTAFEDWPDPERKRHLVRIWVRNHGRRFYAG